MQKAKRSRRPSDAYPFSRYKANKLRRIDKHIRRLVKGKAVSINDLQAIAARERIKALTAFPAGKRNGARQQASKATIAMKEARDRLAAKST